MIAPVGVTRFCKGKSTCLHQLNPPELQPQRIGGPRLPMAVDAVILSLALLKKRDWYSVLPCRGRQFRPLA